jgi:hypothetical protein
VVHHLASSVAAPPPQILDPYPDPGDYRGKALAYITKPDSSAAGEPAPNLKGAGPTIPSDGTVGAGSAAVPAPVLTPEDHAHFLRTGFVHLKGAIPPESVARALANIKQPRPDCARLHAAVRVDVEPRRCHSAVSSSVIHRFTYI